jgi:hypothetical protein
MRIAARWLSPVQPRRGLVAVGRRSKPRQLERLRVMLGAIEQGQWLGGSGQPVQNFSDRFVLFGEALRRVHGERPLYLEFGVYRGRSLAWWAKHLACPGARLVGFDSFDGLPEDWAADAPKGTFKVAGPPDIADERVSFVPGWFDQTLPGWQLPEHDQLIVNIDCDLYSSTSTVLTWLTPHLRLGSLVYFDDLLDRDHQLRAIREWMDGPGRAATPVAIARWGQHMLMTWRGSAEGGSGGALGEYGADVVGGLVLVQVKGQGERAGADGIADLPQ